MSSLIKVDRAKHKKRQFDEALSYFHRGVHILKEVHLTNHSEIAYGVEWIAFTWIHKESYDRAIEYYGKCQRIREITLSPKDSITIETLLKIGHIQRTHHQ